MDPTLVRDFVLALLIGALVGKRNEADIAAGLGSRPFRRRTALFTALLAVAGGLLIWLRPL